jgi:hypothetical protein
VGSLRVLLAFYLEPELVEWIARGNPAADLSYGPDLLPVPAFAADHAGRRRHWCARPGSRYGPPPESLWGLDDPCRTTWQKRCPTRAHGSPDCSRQPATISIRRSTDQSVRPEPEVLAGGMGACTAEGEEHAGET